MRVKGINVSGAVLLDLDLADTGASEPFFFDNQAAVGTVPVATTAAAAGPKVHTPPEAIESAVETFHHASENEADSSDEVIFRTATEFELEAGADDSLAGAECKSDVSACNKDAKKNWRALAASVSLSRAAQKAQSERAEHSESDIATDFRRQHSDQGHGPFDGVALEPKEGMHSISMLVRIHRLSTCNMHSTAPVAASRSRGIMPWYLYLK